MQEKHARSLHLVHTSRMPICTYVPVSINTVRIRSEKNRKSDAQRFFSPVTSRMQPWPPHVLCRCPVGSAHSLQVNGGTQSTNRRHGPANTPMPETHRSGKICSGERLVPYLLELLLARLLCDLLGSGRSVHRDRHHPNAARGRLIAVQRSSHPTIKRVVPQTNSQLRLLPRVGIPHVRAADYESTCVAVVFEPAAARTVPT